MAEVQMASGILPRDHECIREWLHNDRFDFLYNPGTMLGIEIEASTLADIDSEPVIMKQRSLMHFERKVDGVVYGRAPFISQQYAALCADEVSGEKICVDLRGGTPVSYVSVIYDSGKMILSKSMAQPNGDRLEYTVLFSRHRLDAPKVIMRIHARKDCQFCFSRGTPCECSEVVRQRSLRNCTTHADKDNKFEGACRSTLDLFLLEQEKPNEACFSDGSLLASSSSSSDSSSSSSIISALALPTRAQLMHAKSIECRARHRQLQSQAMVEDLTTAFIQMQVLRTLPPNSSLSLRCADEDMWLLAGLVRGDALEEDTRLAPLQKQGTCELCGKCFTRQHDLTRHVRTVHIGERPFRCEQCSSAFAQRSHLREHTQSVHLRVSEVQCATCGQTFSTKHKLTRHFKTVHLRMRSAQCAHCGHRFTQTSDLRKHLRNQHLEDEPRHVT